MRFIRDAAAVAVALAMSATPAPAATLTVTIDDLDFAPAKVTARVGDTIVWVNKDAFAHTATVAGKWEVMIPPGASAGRIVQEPGTVEYVCRFHPNMKGRITVTPP